MATLSSHVEAARSALLSEDYDATARLCQRILDRFPRHIETYALLAEAYRELGWRDEAEDLFRRVVSADPEHLVARWGLSLLCEARGDMAQAVSHLQVAVDLAPAVPALRPELERLTGGASDGNRPTPAGLARVWANAGLADRALRAYDSVLISQPYRLDVLVAMAELLWRSRETDLAIQVARRALADSPDCLKANLIVARALELEGRTDEAEPHYERAVALDPEGHARVDLFGADGAELASVTLPDPEVPAVAAVVPPPSAAADWHALPVAAAPAAPAPPVAASRASAAPADPTVPDNWMAIDDQDLDVAPAEVEMASAEELAAFEASLLSDVEAPPAPSAAPVVSQTAPPPPIPIRPNIAAQPPAASIAPPAPPVRVPPPEEFEETPVEDWLEPAPPPPTPIASAPSRELRANVPPPAFSGRIEAPVAPAPLPVPDLPADSEWSKLLSEEIEMDEDQQARLRAALLDAGLMPPDTAVKAPPASVRPLRSAPRRQE